MVLHSKLTDPMDPKILPVSYKDKLVGRDEKKVSDEKKDENDPSFDGLRDVDSFASSEAMIKKCGDPEARNNQRIRNNSYGMVSFRLFSRTLAFLQYLSAAR